MSCAGHLRAEHVEDGTPLVAVAGCPNVGKSVLFGALSDAYVDVSNYPGTTVDTTVATVRAAAEPGTGNDNGTRTGNGNGTGIGTGNGTGTGNGKAAGIGDGGGEYALVDTPGVHGISSFDEPERVTRDIVLEADAVVDVVSATHLDRDLFLTLQLLDMGIPTVVALNMMDEAARDGIDIDVQALEARLGVPVVPMVAVTGVGVDDLRARLDEAAAPDRTPIERWFDRLPESLDVTRAEKTLLVEADEPTVQRVVGDRDEASIAADGGAPSFVEPSLRDEVYADRRQRIGNLTDAVVSTGETARTLADRVGDLMVRPLTGTPIALAALGLIYYLIGDLVAQRLVDVLEVELFGELYNPFVTGLVDAVLPAADWAEPVRFLLVNDNLGLLTVTVQYLAGVLLPLVVSFYLAIGVLEDSGVLPRLAVLTDRGLTRVGLNGRAIIPMIVGVGCVTMAVITTRMVGSRRDRLVATALLGLAIPCSAQLGVIMGLLAGLGLRWWFGYVAVLLAVFGFVGLFLDRVLPGQAEGLITELPRLRPPRPSNVIRKTATRTRMFLREAGVLFGIAALGISALDYVGGLAAVQRALAPLTDLVGLPDAFAQVLVLGVIRRDFAAAGMTDLALSPAEVFVGLVVVTLFVPCILSMVVIAKERDLRTGVAMWLGSWTVAFAVGAVLAGVLGA